MGTYHGKQTGRLYPLYDFHRLDLCRILAVYVMPGRSLCYGTGQFLQGENLGFPYFNHCIFVPGGQHCGVVRDFFGEDSGFGQLGQPNEFSSADPFLDFGVSSLLRSFRLYTGKEEKLLIPFHLWKNRVY